MSGRASGAADVCQDARESAALVVRDRGVRGLAHPLDIVRHAIAVVVVQGRRVDPEHHVVDDAVLRRVATGRSGVVLKIWIAFGASWVTTCGGGTSLGCSRAAAVPVGTVAAARSAAAVKALSSFEDPPRRSQRPHSALTAGNADPAG
jgi:hypothetical protein